jgi:hypothetical protein
MTPGHYEIRLLAKRRAHDRLVHRVFPYGTHIDLEPTAAQSGRVSLQLPRSICHEPASRLGESPGVEERPATQSRFECSVKEHHARCEAGRKLRCPVYSDLTRARWVGNGDQDGANFRK